MSYVLVHIEDNWADELDTEGFLIGTQKEVDDYLSKIKQYFIDNPGCSLSYSIGSNEEIEHNTFKSIERCLRIKKIKEEEYKTIKKVIGTSFGKVTLWDILEYN